MRRTRRNKRPPLRGSVTQNQARVRMQAKDQTALSFMLRLGSLIGSVVIILGLAAWLWHIGWPQKQAERIAQAGLHVTQAARFSVKDINVVGRDQTSKDQLSSALGITLGSPIFSFDPAAAQARIAKLPWVASVTVERFLPDTIFIHLTERQAMARWQHEGRTVVIDMQGEELQGASLDQFASLPLVVGIDAPPETKTLIDQLRNYPAITDKLVAAVRVGGRRWDLHLQPKVVARMPEEGADAALRELSSLITDKKILDHDIAAVDLRLPDRITIESSQPVTPHTDGGMHL